MKKEEKKRREKIKQSKTNDRCSEECDARISERKGKERKGKASRGTPYVLKRNRYVLHGQNNTKKITAVARTKHEEDNCCFKDKNNTKKTEIQA